MNQDEVQAGASAGEEPAGEMPSDPMAALEAERDQYKALAQRTQADFINYKRRTEEERSVLVRNAANNVIVRLLPIVDDLWRAVEALPEDAPPKWTEGVKLITQNLQSVLESEGVTLCEPGPGDPFDPAEQEALYYQPTSEQPPGSVLMLVARGYRTQDRVLRPAQVVVAREPEEQAGEPGD